MKTFPAWRYMVPVGRSEKVFKISPSAVATWLECKRKWAWRHIKGIEVPQAASAALGTEGHAQLEAYLGEETPIDFTKKSGYVVAAALPLLPAPKTPGLALEEYFTYTSPKGIAYHGYMDVMGPDSSVFPKMPPPPPGFVKVPIVSDHKTTSNFEYAKSAADLKKDPQGVIYAKVLFDKFPDAVYGDLVWTYMLTRGTPKVKRVHLRVLRDDVDKEFERLELTAAEMTATYRAKTEPLDLPPTLASCKMYGGCPHHPSKGGHCSDLAGVQTSLNPSGKKMSQDTKSMFDNLLARNPVPNNASQLPTSSFGAQAVTTTTAAPLPGVTDVPAGFALPSFLTAAKDPGPAVNLASTFTAPSAPLGQTTLFPVPAINPPGEASPVSSVLAQPPAPAAEATEKPKRVRRTKAQIEADEAAAAAAKLGLVPAQSQTIQTTGEVQTTVQYVAPPNTAQIVDQNKADGASFTLFVDCIPDHGFYLNAHTIIQNAHERVKKEAETVDYRLVEYGKGAAALVACVKEAIPDLDADVVLDSNTPEGKLVLNTFAAAAGLVVRGLR